MSISFTSSSIIEYCIDEEFKNNSIRYLRHLGQKAPLHDLEALIEIDDDKLYVINHTMPEKDKWRFDNTLNLILTAIKKFSLQLNCRFILNLNDGCPADEKFTRISTFGRHIDSNHISITDPASWSLVSSNKILDTLREDIEFDFKQNKIVFRGSDTGKLRNNFLNQRISFCNSHIGSSLIDSKITFFAGHNTELLDECGIDKQNISSGNMSSSEQLKYKYLLYMHGNSVSPERLLWILSSNSLLLEVAPKKEEDDIVWFYKFLTDNNYIPRLSEDNFLKDFNELSQKDIVSINEKQKNISKHLLNPNLHIEYTKNLLLKYQEIYSS
jgi:hypothetical protein